MGSLSDMNDLDRFMRSAKGQASLEQVRRTPLKRCIVGVEFRNEVCRVGIALALDDGSTIQFTRPELEIDTLREDFAGAIDEEYSEDYPMAMQSAKRSH